MFTSPFQTIVITKFLTKLSDYHAKYKDKHFLKLCKNLNKEAQNSDNQRQNIGEFL